MPLRFHEITERDLRILNSLGDEKLMLLGEIFWWEEPSEEALAAMGVRQGDWLVGLEQLLDIFKESGSLFVEMVLATDTEWGRYESMHWWAVERWIQENPDDPDYDKLAAWSKKTRREYFRYERPLCGWGVFVLRPEF